MRVKPIIPINTVPTLSISSRLELLLSASTSELVTSNLLLSTYPKLRQILVLFSIHLTSYVAGYSADHSYRLPSPAKTSTPSPNWLPTKYSPVFTSFIQSLRECGTEAELSLSHLPLLRFPIISEEGYPYFISLLSQSDFMLNSTQGIIPISRICIGLTKTIIPSSGSGLSSGHNNKYPFWYLNIFPTRIGLSVYIFLYCHESWNNRPYHYYI